jgi:hypothetical protein
MNRSGKGLSDRNTARIIGVLFIVGTVAGIFSKVVTGSIMGAPDYLAQVATHQNQMAIGALLILTMGFALSMVPVVFYPVARRYSEVLAMAYVVFRGAIEGVMYIGCALGALMLVALSTLPAATVGPAAELARRVMENPVADFPFVLGALMYCYVLYSSRLVPRWLSVWGLVGAVLYIGPALLRMFGLSFDYLYGPLALQEMVLAVWLIAKGFNPAKAEVA